MILQNGTEKQDDNFAKKSTCILHIIEAKQHGGWAVRVDRPGSTNGTICGSEQAVMHKMSEILGRIFWGLKGMEFRVTLEDRKTTLRVTDVFVFNSSTNFYLESEGKENISLFNVIIDLGGGEPGELAGKSVVIEDLNPLPETVDEYSIPLAFYDPPKGLRNFNPRTDEEILDEIERSGDPYMYRGYLPKKKASKYYTEEELRQYEIGFFYDREDKSDFQQIYKAYIYKLCSSLLNFKSITSGAQSTRIYPWYLQSLAFMLRFDSVYEKIAAVSLIGPLTMADIIYFALKELGLAKHQFVCERIEEIEEVTKVWAVKG